jgi:hypothetical protein
MKKVIKILCVVTNSIGELDVLFPIFAKLSKISKAKFTVVLPSPAFSKKYFESNFYKYCEDSLTVNVITLDMSSKKKGDFAVLMAHKFHYIFSGVRLLLLLFSHNIYIHDFTNILSKTKALQLAAKILKRKIFAIPHGLFIQINCGHCEKYNNSDILQMLIFDSDTKNTHYKMGYENLHNIGYVKYYPEWLKLVHDFPNDFNSEPYVVLLSRPVHEQYMDKDKYIYLFSSSIESIKKVFGNIKIIVKMHPRESESSIKLLLKKSVLSNVVFTRECTSIVCKDAIASIGFWTSAIIDSAAVNTPVLEYYIEADRFRELEIYGSVYPGIGFAACNNVKELVRLLMLIKQNKKISDNTFLERVERNMPTNKNLLNIFSPN